MTLPLDPGIVALVLGVLNVLGLVYTMAVRLARLEFKTDTMWEFTMRRAMAEALDKGVVTKRSRVRLNPEHEVVRRFREDHEFLRTVRHYYEEKLRFARDREVFWRLEGRFGSELLEKICIPAHLSYGACLIAAMQLCREEESSHAP